MTSTPRNILVTGATGFIGSHVCRAALAAGHVPRAAVRSAGSIAPEVSSIVVGEVDGDTDWAAACAGIDAVVHLAGRAHVFEAENEASRNAFQSINRDGTINLARQAARAGVKRFVFISSIGVNGVRTEPDRRFRPDSKPAPHNAYAESKWFAESALHALAAESGMEVVILRPPLVYGPGNKGNFLRLMKLVEWSLPLPFASTDNLRSMIYVGNLADAILRCCTHPRAANKTYLVSDMAEISTANLIRAIAKRLGKPCRLFRMSHAFTRLLASMVGNAEAVDRLVESLAVDATAIASELDWRPPFTLELGLDETVAWFKSEYGRR